MGAAKVSKFTEVRIPEGATEVKGAIRVDGMDDVYILSFVTDEEKAVSISEDLNAEKPLRRVKKMASATGDFDQLGLADPDTLDNVRWTGVCPSCVRDKRRKGVLQIDIYVQPRPQGKARVYVRAL
ncbi:hypothetical protein [Streptomyces sp. NPDC020141]|uniref:hypothetical protein n=1 Tax=Streptomyces sp. NPDC020141 TaxID=3365065 RepID=UPI00378C862A